MSAEPEQWAEAVWLRACSTEDPALTIQRAFEERERNLREENERLRESLRNSMPIAGGNPFGKPSQALKDTTHD